MKTNHIQALLKDVLENVNAEVDISLSTNNCKELLFAKRFLVHILLNEDKYLNVYEQLEDDMSRRIFDWTIQYKVCSLFSEEIARKAYKLYDDTKNNEIIVLDDKLQIGKYIISSEYRSTYEAWVKEIYTINGFCEPQKGNIIISGGAFRGESSIWFADKVGADGKVYAFEPSKETYSVLVENINSNQLTDIVVPVNQGLWENKRFLFLDQSKGYDSPDCKCGESGSIQIEAIDIDTFVAERNIERVDYIKLDVESSEMMTLLGAHKTIARFMPKLSICLYHKPEDLVDIYTYLKQTYPQYSFRLSNKIDESGNMSNWFQLVLFANSQNRPIES